MRRSLFHPLQKLQEDWGLKNPSNKIHLIIKGDSLIGKDFKYDVNKYYQFYLYKQIIIEKRRFTKASNMNFLFPIKITDVAEFKVKSITSI